MTTEGRLHDAVLSDGAAPLDQAALTGAEYAAMERACDLAARGAGSALPNPVVGCVLLSPEGEQVGEGFHHHAGGPHAEIVALSAAASRAAGATAVVTLEPCNHTGRTGPCSEALIDAGVARVIVAVRDPWPTAAGGIDRLRDAGIDVVDLADPALAMTNPSADPDSDTVHLVAAAVDINRVWLKAMRHQRPFVTLKLATTIDGRVAASDGSSRWISSPESRAAAHRMRSEIDCIAVGVGTVLADDPQLTARGDDGALAGRQPLRVVFDSAGRTPITAKIRSDDAPTLIATAAEYGAGPGGHVDLLAVLRALFNEGRRHLLVEGGPRVAAAVLDAGLVDEVLIYLAPLVLGAGRSALEGGAAATLTDAHAMELREVRRLGADVLLRYSACDESHHGHEA